MSTTPQEAAYAVARNDPSVDHIWLNAFACIRPTDEFAAKVGRDVISKVMEASGRKVVLTVNAS
ncbi:MAG: hypothetical protein ACO1ON_12940 [Nocardioides sp.]